MSSLTVRRLLVWIIGMGLGFLGGFLIITIGFDALPLFTSVQSKQGITIAQFGTIYYLVTSIPIGLIFVVWIDYFVGSKILPE